MSTPSPTEWAYRASGSKLDFHGTSLLAGRGFLCRSAHDANGTRAANVASVRLGDFIHFYYTRGGGRPPRVVGRFQVVTPEATLHGDCFGDQVAGTALFRVADATPIREIDSKGVFLPDSVLRTLTAWAIRRSGVPVEYPREEFRGRSTLVRLAEVTGV